LGSDVWCISGQALREAKIVFKDRGTALRARLQEADEAKQELATAEAALQGAEAQVEDSTNVWSCCILDLVFPYF
jgi:hypothetical protein